MSAPATSPRTSSPSLLYVQGAEQRTIELEHTPFTIGRKTDKDLVIPDSRVSRDHAQIISENGDFWVIDQGSRHGTYVNGIKRDRHKLEKNDRVDFGARDAAYLVFAPDHPQSSAAAEFLSQISMVPGSAAPDSAYRAFAPDPPQPSAAAEVLSQISMLPVPAGSSDLEKLRLFLE